MNKRFTWYGGILVVALACFLVFNLVTTIDAFKWLFGTGILLWLGAGFSLVDFAGLARMFAPALAKDQAEEDSMKLTLLIAWLLSAAADFLLTVLWARIYLVNSNIETLVESGVLLRSDIRLMPYLVAAIEAGLRLLLVSVLAKWGERIVRTTVQEKKKEQKPVISQQSFPENVFSRPAHTSTNKKRTPRHPR